MKTEKELKIKELRKRLIKAMIKKDLNLFLLLNQKSKIYKQQEYSNTDEL